MAVKYQIFALAVVVIILVFSYQESIPTFNLSPHKTLRRVLQIDTNAEELLQKISDGYIKSTYHMNKTGNLPDFYLNDKLRKPSGINKTCSKFPDFFTLKYRGDFFQIQSTSNGTLHLFNAYVDKREGSFIRIVGLYDFYRVQAKFFCLLWYEGVPQPEVVESEVPYWIFSVKWGADNGYFFHPYIFSCPLVSVKGKLPISVSLVEKFCANPSNNLKIFHNSVEPKKDFVVCVKGLNFPYSDESLRLIEWIELLNLLGAEKINFYEFNVHPNIQKVLNYYMEQGIVEVTPISLAGDSSNHPYFQNLFLKKKIVARRLQEVVPYNDCLYKHLDQFRYVVLLDTDEVIVPNQGLTWINLTESMEKSCPECNTYVARNVYFMDTHLHQHDWFDGIPRKMHMLQHVYRSKNFTKPGFFVKGFHNTRKVFALHNHFPFKCLQGCKNKEMDVELGQLQHYRADCASGVSDCKSLKENSVVDTRIWSYQDELMERMQKTCTMLGLDLE